MERAMKVFCLALAAALAAVPVHADNGLAEDPAAFLRLPTDARLLGMGQAQSAVAEGPAAIVANPAGLPWQRSAGLKTTSGVLGLDRSHIFLGMSVPFRLRYSGWERVNHMALALGGALTSFKISGIEERDSFGLRTGSFDDTERAYHIAFGFKASDSFSLGASGRIIKQSLQSASAKGSGVDVGFLWRQQTERMGRFDFAFVAKDFKGGLDWEGRDEGLNNDFAYSEPLRNKNIFGLGYVLNPRWRFALDLVTSSSQAGRLHFGSEWQAFPQFQVRAGINSYDPTLGFGYELAGEAASFSIDYAFVYGLRGPGQTHWFTLGVKFLPIGAGK